MFEGILATIVVFSLLTVVNVVLNTARTILTVKGGMFISAFISALAFGFYTVFTVYIVSTPLDNLTKGLITALVNFGGVYLVKWVENIMRKDRLWDVQVVIYGKNLERVRDVLNGDEIQFTELPITNSDSHLFHIYSETQDDSKKIRTILSLIGARYFVSESKNL